MKKNIIIDCDPGHDDMLAIMVALANKDKFNLLGISTVAGNQTIEKITQNALNIISYLKEDVPVCKGSQGPIIKTADIGVGQELHGETGLGGYDLPLSSEKAVTTNVVEFLRDKILSAKGKVTLIPTGPLTNIARLFVAYPELIDKIDMISLMGGSLVSGNITPHAEFNIWADPEAAQIVFNLNVPIVAAMLEATHQAFLPLDKIISLSKSSRPMSKVIGCLNLFHAEYFKAAWDMKGVPVHDACAVFYLIHPEMFKVKPYDIKVIPEGIFRGKTTTDLREWARFESSKTKIIHQTDGESFIEELMKVIDYYDQKLLEEV